MKISAELTPDAINLTYSIANDVGEVVFLRNLLTDWYGVSGDPALNRLQNHNAGVTSAICFACATRAGLALLQGEVSLPNQPGGIMPFAPRVPLATRLDVGGSFKATIRVPLPVLEWHAYLPPKADNCEEVNVVTVSLAVEYYRQSSLKRAERHPTFQGAWVVGGYPVSRFEADVKLPRPCVLLRRRDPVSRFAE